jgi:hypothetical protein
VFLLPNNAATESYFSQLSFVLAYGVGTAIFKNSKIFTMLRQKLATSLLDFMKRLLEVALLIIRIVVATRMMPR